MPPKMPGSCHAANVTAPLLREAIWRRGGEGVGLQLRDGRRRGTTTAGDRHKYGAGADEDHTTDGQRHRVARTRTCGDAAGVLANRVALRRAEHGRRRHDHERAAVDNASVAGGVEALRRDSVVAWRCVGRDLEGARGRAVESALTVPSVIGSECNTKVTAVPTLKPPAEKVCDVPAATEPPACTEPVTWL